MLMNEYNLLLRIPEMRMSKTLQEEVLVGSQEINVLIGLVNRNEYSYCTVKQHRLIFSLYW